MEQTEGIIHRQLVDYIVAGQGDFYRLAYSYVQNRDAALDVVQESAYKAIRDCGRVKEKKYIGTWIYRIVVNTALDALRRRGRETSLEEGWREESWLCCSLPGS